MLQVLLLVKSIFIYKAHLKTYGDQSAVKAEIERKNR